MGIAVVDFPEYDRLLLAFQNLEPIAAAFLGQLERGIDSDEQFTRIRSLGGNLAAKPNTHA